MNEILDDADDQLSNYMAALAVAERIPLSASDMASVRDSMDPDCEGTPIATIADQMQASTSLFPQIRDAITGFVGPPAMALQNSEPPVLESALASLISPDTMGLGS